MEEAQFYGIFLGTFLTMLALRQAIKLTGKDRWIFLVGGVVAAAGQLAGIWTWHTRSDISLMLLLTSMLIFIAVLSGPVLLRNKSS